MTTQIQIFYRELTLQDLPTWEKLAKSEFTNDDFCSADFLLGQWDKTKGWVLMDKKGNWMGCCFIDFNEHTYNIGGIHFLEYCIFPEFRGKGYAKYLAKIFFDNSNGYTKSACVHPHNTPSIAVIKKYGFKKVQQHKIWDAYICDKNYYPEELKDLHIQFLPPKKCVARNNKEQPSQINTVRTNKR